VGSSFRDGPKDQTGNLEIPGSRVSLAPWNDGLQRVAAGQLGADASEQFDRALLIALGLGRKSAPIRPPFYALPHLDRRARIDHHCAFANQKTRKGARNA
jgi:hypothetical protein